MNNPFIKILSLLLVIGLNWAGLSAVGETVSYFYDVETSSGNIYTADSLDFALSSHEYESSIGPGETVSKSSVLVNSGGMEFQYILEAEEIFDDDGFCDALNLQAKLNGVEKYDGNLMLLNTSASAVLGTWQFNIELPVNEDSFTNGEECRFDIIFKGWQTNVISYGDGGFTDEERISFILTAGRMVVLNEFLPRPDGIAYGFDFGNDSSDMPQGEWIELYNNSTESVDVAGWYTRDATDGEGNKVAITAFNTSLATTIIEGKSWLVVYMNKAILNNTGDTVRLFNSDDVLIDLYEYEDSDFCEIKPSPGDENSTDVSGECGGVPPNKSYARVPDGIGAWVDPIPTPGGMNRLNEVEEVIVTENTSSLVVEIQTAENGDVPADASEIANEDVMPEEEPVVEQEEIPAEENIIEENSQEIPEIIEVILDESEVGPSAGEAGVSPEDVAIEQPVIIEEPVIVEQPAPESPPPSGPEPDSNNSNENNSGENL